MSDHEVAKNRMYCGEAGIPRDLADFDFAAENANGFMWERREPGMAIEDSWEDGEHEHPTLKEAVEAALPYHAEYGLTLEQAAHLCLRLGLVLGTGVPVVEDELDEKGEA